MERTVEVTETEVIETFTFKTLDEFKAWWAVQKWPQDQVYLHGLEILRLNE